ncbi:MAG: hypothetical protein ACJAZN_000382 [Planctomycetota bacterium]|jgi:hypothetical protein
MMNRRSALTRMALGGGAVALSPFLRHLRMLDEPGEDAQLPKRFVFVLKSSGLQAEYLNPEGLTHGGRDVVNEALGQRALHAGMSCLEPFRRRLTILQGLSGRMCTIGHSSFYGALGAYKASAETQPSAATIDGHLSTLFPSVFNHVGLKMGTGSQGTAYPALSATGRGEQLPYQCNPALAYQSLFGSIATGGDIKRKYERTGNVLEAMAGDIRRLRGELPSDEREKLGHYLNGFEALRDRRLELISMQDVLRAHAPDVTDKYTSDRTTQHLEAHFDMAAAALITGITNVATVHCDDLDSTYAGLGITPKVHSIGHGSSSGALSSQDCRNRIRTFHFELIAALAAKLEAVPEGDGSMLDNTVIVYVSDNSDKHHSTGVEWPMVVLGDLGGKLKSAGRYIAYPAYGAPAHHHTIGNWHTTLCHAAGAPQEHFGQPDYALGKLADQSGPLTEVLA